MKWENTVHFLYVTAEVSGCVCQPESSLQWQWSVRGNRLELGPLTLSHAGTYTCLVKNSEGQTQKDFALTVLGKIFPTSSDLFRFSVRIYGDSFIKSLWLPVSPTILNSDQASDVSGPIGEELTLDCRANGIPPPRFSWLKDGESLEGSDTHHIS